VPASSATSVRSVGAACREGAVQARRAAGDQFIDSSQFMTLVFCSRPSLVLNSMSVESSRVTQARCLRDFM